jgi:putative ATPase
VSLFDLTPPGASDSRDPTSSPDASVSDATRPLADRMRPRTLDEFVGQEHIVGPGTPLLKQMESGALSSLILWGPPGVGKTTLGRLMAHYIKADFIPFSAVLSGVKEIKAVMADSQKARRTGRRTVLFIDEIHRFNKAQQDAFLPYVERGDVILVGATTENPSFEVVSALLSRARVYPLNQLEPGQVVTLLRRALDDIERGLGQLHLAASEEVLAEIAVASSGDARAALNTLELAAGLAEEGAITHEAVAKALQRKVLLYDKSGDEHFNLISALHKSVRSSDPDAALYWLGRMLESGEDRLYLARRLVRMAIEDIGLADPRAIEQAIAAMQTVHFLGMPEGDLALGQLAVYLALAPKSDSTYRAMNKVREVIASTVAEPVPLHIRNAPTRLMKDLGYASGYEHAHLDPEALTSMTCLPDALASMRFYEPSERGFEQKLRERLAWLTNRKRERREPDRE